MWGRKRLVGVAAALVIAATALVLQSAPAHAASLSGGCSLVPNLNLVGNFGALSGFSFNAGEVVTFTVPPGGPGSASISVNGASVASGTFSPSAGVQLSYTIPTSGTFASVAFTKPIDSPLGTVACGIPPTIAVPSNVTVTAPSDQCSAQVTFPAPTFTGAPVPAVGISHSAGSTFPVGETTVTAIATNSVGSATGSFTVTVTDATPPSITVGPDRTVNATSPAGAVVTYPAPTASDNCPGLEMACAPPSGSGFAVGTTSVTCTATDVSDNTASATFQVKVVGAKGQLDVIVAQARATLGKSRYAFGLQDAQSALASGNTRGACRALRDWLALVAGGINVPAAASALGPAVNQVRAVIPCTP